MNTSSETRAPAASEPSRRILVWDLPVRLFHWLLAFSFAGAYLTAESERWHAVHVTLGYTVAGLVVFRLLWGLVGSRHARFAAFVRGPRAVLAYLKSFGSAQPQRHVGHNPAGALAIVALLGLALVVTASGWATFNDIGGEWLEELHEGAANTMLALVIVHIAAVILSSVLHRENLVRAMLDGRKQGQPNEGIRSTRRLFGLLLLAAVLGFWWLQWQAPPAALQGAQGTAIERKHHDRDDD